MANRDHAGSTRRALPIFFGQRIYFFIMDRKICEHLIIVRFGLTFPFAGLYFDELRLNELRQWFLPGTGIGEKA